MRELHAPQEAADEEGLAPYLNNSSWLPFRSKNATSSFEDQISSQSPAFAT